MPTYKVMCTEVVEDKHFPSGYDMKNVCKLETTDMFEAIGYLAHLRSEHGNGWVEKIEDN